MIRALAWLIGTVLVAVVAAGCNAVTPHTPTATERADGLARSVVQATGRGVWPRVSTVAFNFVVREGDQVKVSRSHLWNVKAGTDTVGLGDRSVTVDVNKPNMDDAAEAEAFKAWTNDTYWLIAPLKLFDAGVTREYLGRREVAGKEYEVLGLSFASVGMTPGDRYNLYVDPYTSLVAYWDYMPTPEKSMQATWEAYQHPQGMSLATWHLMGTKTIAMEHLSVTVE